MRAVVTGGAGFIGSHLVDRLLEADYHVTVIDDLSTGSADRRAYEDPRCELVTEALPARAAMEAIVDVRPQAIYHLAAQPSVPPSIDDPLFDAERNVLGSLAVLEAARRVPDTKVVYAASGGALYGAGGPFPAQEDQLWSPEHPYGISKAVVLHYLEFYRAHHGLASAALALANVYGPRQSSDAEGGVVAIFVNAGRRGDDLTVFGSGSQTRDFVFVHDVVDAFLRAGQSDAGGIINIGSGRETSVRELAETVQGLYPDVDIVQGASRPMDVERSVLDAGRARERLGWVATTPLAEGVAAVAADLSERGLPRGA